LPERQLALVCLHLVAKILQRFVVGKQHYRFVAIHRQDSEADLSPFVFIDISGNGNLKDQGRINAIDGRKIFIGRYDLFNLALDKRDSGVLTLSPVFFLEDAFAWSLPRT
jgi:hypothetical protein